MEKLKFIDDDNLWYEFYFLYDEQDQNHYVEIIRHDKKSWVRFARIADPVAHIIKWINSDEIWGKRLLISEKAKCYIDKVYKNKAFI